MSARFLIPDLTAFATSLLHRAGLDPDKAAVTAEILVEGDLWGHTTHGLQLLASYLKELESGAMAKTGHPLVVADFPAAVTWDAQRLPGPWVTQEAIAVATRRAKTQGTCTVVIRRSHHLACLAAYLKPVADQNLAIVLMCSDPTVGGVAPHGGRRGLYTPNPIAAAWPTRGDPVIFDVSQSITTHGMIRRLHAERKKLPGSWVIDPDGRPSDDPGVLFMSPPGALLPVGGLDHGHKGYAMGLLVETLTGGLAAHGRADPPEGWSANVHLQVFAPELFGGLDGFLRQTTWLSDACRQTPPRSGVDQVRLPGQQGLRRREQQLESGVELHPAILPSLEPWMAKLGIARPAPITP
jgi:LDH2 family malate/lactate/ureidoglycolate dehydrogenase